MRIINYVRVVWESHRAVCAFASVAIATSSALLFGWTLAPTPPSRGVLYELLLTPRADISSLFEREENTSVRIVTMSQFASNVDDQPYHIIFASEWLGARSEPDLALPQNEVAYIMRLGDTYVAAATPIPDPYYFGWSTHRTFDGRQFVLINDGRSYWFLLIASLLMGGGVFLMRFGYRGRDEDWTCHLFDNFG